MEFSFKYKNKKIKLDVKECKGTKMGIGLMFKRRKNARALLFEFNKPTGMALTSLFCFFSFVVVWFKDDKVVDIKVVKPWRFIINSKNSFDKILEIPINQKYRRQINVLVGRQKI